MVRWVNGYLRWRIQDLYSPDKDAPLSLDAPIASDFGEITLLDKLPNFTLSGLDGLIENSQRETTQRIGLELELYIEQDPEGKLKNSYPSSSPQCNCQLLSQKRVLKEPPEKFADIARDWLDWCLYAKDGCYGFIAGIPVLALIAAIRLRNPYTIKVLVERSEKINTFLSTPDSVEFAKYFTDRINLVLGYAL
ncbi:MAG: hypothetical protein DSM106950_02790 [Stigonema ocellatum SAG 48.90 = DSM 106950]|nr:hypothetical protein [Stigonema ocellatum SAG 48.90 = DSM 106950]